MQLFLNILISTSIYLLLSLSLSTIYKSTKFLHLAHASSIAFGAYFIYFFLIQLSLNLAFSIILSLIGSFLIIVIIEKLYMLINNPKKESWKMLIASLGIYIILENIIALIFGDSRLSFRNSFDNEVYQVMGATITKIQLVTVLSSTLLVLIVLILLNKTRMGSEIKAISSNKMLGEILGISKTRAILNSYFIGSSLATCAGILIAADTDMTPRMGFSWLLYAIVAMVIGGLGKTWFLVLGSLLLASTQHLSAYYWDSKWMNATAYVILILFLAWKPYGFSGKKLKKVEI